MGSPNTLYFGDNLSILRQYVADESVDLVYLDPPFNSSRQYNVLYSEKSGKRSSAQSRAFMDTWTWDEAAQAAYTELRLQKHHRALAKLVDALYQLLGDSDLMAYLCMMGLRLIELHRVLKPTGSLYLHCDPAASHYLKLTLDAIFDPRNFLNEIVWKRTAAHSSAKKFAPVHDILLFYTKSNLFTWNDTRTEYDPAYIAKYYRFDDGDGRRYAADSLHGSGIRAGESGRPWRGIDITARGRHWMVGVAELDSLDASGRIYWPPKKDGMPRYKRYRDEMGGKVLSDLWIDVECLNSQAKERLGYPTQKPLALLERIIASSCNPGDVVLDPFCGCGTAVVAAQKLDRRWIGIDITHLAIQVMRDRLNEVFGSGVQYTVIGEPQDWEGAEALALQDRHRFQEWALSLVGALPDNGHVKKGADHGIDGISSFVDFGDEPMKECVISVKSGHNIGVGDVRDLKGTVDKRAQMGLLISLYPPTVPMLKEALRGGYYREEVYGTAYPMIQIRTIAQLLAGDLSLVPLAMPGHALKVAKRTYKRTDQQGELFGVPTAKQTKQPQA